MQINYAINDRCNLTVETKDLKHTFDFLSYADSIFKVSKCGNCGSPHLRFETRTPKGFTYRSLVCNDCHHTLKVSEQKPENGGRLYTDKEWMPPFYGDNNDGGSRGQSQHREEPQYEDVSF